MFTIKFQELLNEYKTISHKVAGLLIEVDILRKEHNFITVPFSRTEMPSDKKEFSCKLMDEIYIIDNEIEVVEKSLAVVKSKIKNLIHENK